MSEIADGYIADFITGTIIKGTPEEIEAVQPFSIKLIERSGKEYMTWEEFISHPVLFPFRIENVTQADMASCEHLCLERMGDDIVIRLLQN